MVHKTFMNLRRGDTIYTVGANSDGNKAVIESDVLSINADTIDGINCLQIHAVDNAENFTTVIIPEDYVDAQLYDGIFLLKSDAKDAIQ